jgi:hypothetical protein
VTFHICIRCNHLEAVGVDILTHSHTQLFRIHVTADSAAVLMWMYVLAEWLTCTSSASPYP